MELFKTQQHLASHGKHGAPPQTKLEPRPAITGGYKRLGGALQVPAEAGWKKFSVVRVIVL